MAEGLKEIVFAKNVVEFVTVANEYCSFVEHSSEYNSAEFISKSLKLLPLLYLKSQLLPQPEQINDDENEKFVTEFDWQYVRNGIATVLGDSDTYIDNFDIELNETPEPVTYSISENLADVYQDLKDFLEIYKLGNEPLSNDAILEIVNSFMKYWGYRVVNSIRMLHFLHVQANDTDTDTSKLVSRDTSDWFVSKAQNQFKSHE